MGHVERNTYKVLSIDVKMFVAGKKATINIE